ncbi:MAG TPA: LytTR family DNA-binding domain-containing protein, partial [Sphingobacteriaceae bacterium]
KLKCIAIDDEPLALDLIAHYAASFDQLELLRTFEDAISGAEFLKHNPVDLLFVDINMPDITGIDLVRALKVKPMIIFITAYKSFAFDGFELNALDFLLKPIQLSRFGKAVQKAIDYFQYKNGANSPSRCLYVYVEYRLMKVELDEIQYIESLEDYIRIHRKDEKPLMTLMSLKKIMEKLPPEEFIRIHRSYVVPSKQIRFLHNQKVMLKSGVALPLGGTYLQSVKSLL